MIKKSTLSHIWGTTRHKYFVFLAGLKTKTPIWQLITHDFSKYSKHERDHYGNQFYGGRGDPIGFSYAWLHHQNLNPHHWEYWLPRTGSAYGDGNPLPMPERYAREMVADWMGASRAYEGKWPKVGEWRWLKDNWDRIKLHLDTREKVLRIMFDAGIGYYRTEKDHHDD